MTIRDLVEVLQKVENQDLEIMLGVRSEFNYLDEGDLSIVTFGLPCDEFGMPLEDAVEQGPTVFAIYSSMHDEDEEDDIEILSNEDLDDDE